MWHFDVYFNIEFRFSKLYRMVCLFDNLWHVMHWYFLNGAFIWKFVVCYVLIFFEWCIYLKICGMLCFDIFWMVRLFGNLWYVMFWYFWIVRLFENLWYVMFWCFLNGAFILRIYGMLWLSYICCCIRYYCWINVRLRKKLKYVYKVFKGIRAGYRQR